MKRIYFDHAATTPIRPEVFEEMLPYLKENFGNPSSIYEIARRSKKAIDQAREKIAKAIHAAPGEVYFTGGGTEADNWAIKGIAENYSAKGKHIITLSIEHHAVLHTCAYLEKKGYKVTYLPVEANGIVNLDTLKAAITEETILISIMFANNEVGVIQPIKEIGELARSKGIFFHTDAVQAVGQVAIDVQEMNIDLMTLSSHKVNGPKGVGALYVRKGIKLGAFIHGGAQESNKRAGTENVAGIVGFGKALELSVQEIPEKTEKILALRNKLIDGVLKSVPNASLNGDREKRLPGNANISFAFIEGESLLLLLDMKGISASSGSACTSGSLDPSHVLLALGVPHEKAHGSLRVTLSKENTAEEIDYFLQELPPIVQRLRDMSPLG